MAGVSSLTSMPHESMFPLTARRATTGSMTAAISTSWGSVQRQRAASTTLGSAYANPEKEARAGEKMVEDRMGMASNGSTSTSSGEDVWFFAIGSMMNPNSLRNRSIKPLQSTPGVLNDFDLIFTGGMGFAEAVRCPGKSFHGVLHLIDRETLERLDKVEIIYERVDGKAIMYDGTAVVATVYTKDIYDDENNPPHQRYLDIMIEGARHFNVHKDHINLLASHDCRPRPVSHEFKSFGEATGPLLSYENDVEPYNGATTPTLRLAVNGKALELCVSDVKDLKIFERKLHFFKEFGHRLELCLSKIMYDPEYGVPDAIDDFTREHSAYIEHNFYVIEDNEDNACNWKVIGRVEQRYCD